MILPIPSGRYSHHVIPLTIKQWIILISIIIQTSIFVISSVILILATKPLVKKFANIDTVKTNAQSIIGKKGLVTKDINSIKATGQVKIDGELWSAVGLNDMDISKGTEVKVIEIKGVKVIVTPIK